MGRELLQRMSDELQTRLKENLESVQQRIRSACERAGRMADEVSLVAVTKYAELDWVHELVKLGVNDLGESRPQQMEVRAKELPPTVRWHMIGHLQRNKAEDVLAIAGLIHSVDSVRLFDHLAKLAQKRGQPDQQHAPRILLEVNVSGEASKDGFGHEELLAAWPRIQDCQSMEIAGLMTMAPLDDNVEVARPVFRALRELRDRLRSESQGRWMLNELSMGMSGDFEVGIEEGATLVRVGSRLFDGLPVGPANA